MSANPRCGHHAGAPVRALELGPHSAAAGAGTLVGPDDIEWSALNHAHGSAENIPALIRALALNTSTWDATLGELFGDDLLHQGDCYSATAPALPFVAQLAISDALPPARRLDLHVWLLSVADCWAASLLADADADRAAAQRRFPTAAPWTQEVHLAVGDQVSALLGRWPAEPPAIQFALACLAALYPQHSQHLTHQTAALAATYAGTQPGVYVELAAALHRTDDDQALALAHQIATWEDDLDQDWLHAPNTTAALRAAHALATGALHPLSHTTTP
ncbi:hypothetical protein AB0878_47515 [Amycolatopsis sp. NPDC047767]|uniref:hypothetical protein n=1 Tax=Amycolatopsis sp. NPDC047767 TaxID=3156765 RepID=UPI0034513756